ncbi:MAG: hypothetical protein KME25_08430 [Symplocastrum torsivum CPER-KK1]|jgi:hypothetical protein|uniref:Poly(3-hydroxyalkanoate) polymerase subunit PhaE n=1 Tax=Symplocastrum torsivum CPER-KK1 TaxID=450513 RepID=A0A951U922_9CYAN|nr:hypothetical protein [Symplocastrum torsivum CPER-KK1]
MDWSNSLEQYLRQLSELQRGIFTSWASMMPNMQSSNMPNARDTFDKTLKFQEQVVTSSLEFQALFSRLSIEAQKQLWESYFNTLRKS